MSSFVLGRGGGGEGGKGVEKKDSRFTLKLYCIWQLSLPRITQDMSQTKNLFDQKMTKRTGMTSQPYHIHVYMHVNLFLKFTELSNIVLVAKSH